MLRKKRSNRSKGISKRLKAPRFTNSSGIHKVKHFPKCVKLSEIQWSFQIRWRKVCRWLSQMYYTALKSYYYDANIIKFPQNILPSLRKFLSSSHSPLLVDFPKMMWCVMVFHRITSCTGGNITISFGRKTEKTLNSNAALFKIGEM